MTVLVQAQSRDDAAAFDAIATVYRAPADRLLVTQLAVVLARHTGARSADIWRRVGRNCFAGRRRRECERCERPCTPVARFRDCGSWSFPASRALSPGSLASASATTAARLPARRSRPQARSWPPVPLRWNRSSVIQVDDCCVGSGRRPGSRRYTARRSAVNGMVGSSTSPARFRPRPHRALGRRSRGRARAAPSSSTSSSSGTRGRSPSARAHEASQRSSCGHPLPAAGRAAKGGAALVSGIRSSSALPEWSEAGIRRQSVRDERRDQPHAELHAALRYLAPRGLPPHALDPRLRGGGRAPVQARADRRLLPPRLRPGGRHRRRRRPHARGRPAVRLLPDARARARARRRPRRGDGRAVRPRGRVARTARRLDAPARRRRAASSAAGASSAASCRSPSAPRSRSTTHGRARTRCCASSATAPRTSAPGTSRSTWRRSGTCRSSSSCVNNQYGMGTAVERGLRRARAVQARARVPDARRARRRPGRRGGASTPPPGCSARPRASASRRCWRR